jgi:hypothetical protein
VRSTNGSKKPHTHIIRIIRINCVRRIKPREAREAYQSRQTHRWHAEFPVFFLSVPVVVGTFEGRRFSGSGVFKKSCEGSAQDL